MPTTAKAIALRDEITVPALNAIKLHSQAAAELLLGTALQESKWVYRRQIGGGPARGLYQREMATHDDIFSKDLKYRSGLRNAVLHLKSSLTAKPEGDLTDNGACAAAMARVLYQRAPKALPKAGDRPAMAADWKQCCNTPLGAGTVDQCIASWSSGMGSPRGAVDTRGGVIGRAGLALWLGCAAAAWGGMDAAPAVELVAGAEWRFAAPPPASLAALDRVWGQFELRLPVKGFSVPAPHCKGEIRLRWIARPPDRSERGARLAQRWALLQRLQALQAPGSADAPERALLDLRRYTRRAKGGRLRLQYCNAFVRKDGL